MIASIESGLKDVQAWDSYLAEAKTPSETFNVFLAINDGDEDLAIKQFNDYCKFLSNSNTNYFFSTLKAKKDENGNIGFIAEYKTNPAKTGIKFDLDDPDCFYCEEALIAQYVSAAAKADYLQEQYAQNWINSKEYQDYINNKIAFEYEIFGDYASSLKSQIIYKTGISADELDKIIQYEYYNQQYQAMGINISIDEFFEEIPPENSGISLANAYSKYCQYMQEKGYTEAQKFSLMFTVPNGQDILKYNLMLQLNADIKTYGAVAVLDGVLGNLKGQQEATYGENELERLYQEYKFDMETYPDRLRSAISTTMMVASVLCMIGVPLPISPLAFKMISIASSVLPSFIRMENLSTNQVNDSEEAQEIANQGKKFAIELVHTLASMGAGMYCNKLNSDEVARLLKEGSSELQALIGGALVEIFADYASGCAIDALFDGGDPNLMGNLINVIFDIAGDVTTWRNFQSGKAVLGNREYNVRKNPDDTRTITISEYGATTRITRDKDGNLILPSLESYGFYDDIEYGEVFDVTLALGNRKNRKIEYRALFDKQGNLLEGMMCKYEL